MLSFCHNEVVSIQIQYAVIHYNILFGSVRKKFINRFALSSDSYIQIL